MKCLAPQHFAVSQTQISLILTLIRSLSIRGVICYYIMWANICLMYLKFYVLHVMNIHVLFCFNSELREDVGKSSFVIIELYSGDLYQRNDMESHFQTI